MDIARLWTAVQSVTPSEYEAGTRWYPDAASSLRALAERHHTPYDRVVYAAAVLSPGLRWPATLELLERLLLAFVAGDPMPRTGHATFGFRPREKAWEILRSGDRAQCSGVKVEAFAAALLGDRDAVVVDRHLINFAGAAGDPADRRRQVHPAESRKIAAAVRTFAYALGLSPRDVTAALWIKATS